MLEIKISDQEFYNEETGTFINIPAQTLRLEHSLVSLSKWESKWHKPFLTNKDKTDEELIDYIRCMTITQNVPDIVFELGVNGSLMTLISEYINDPMTATTFGDKNNRPSREVITAEIIYYWMIAFNIPIECQRWHLNRLLTLVKICSLKALEQNQGKKRRRLSSDDIRTRNELNAKRRAAMNSSG